MKQVNKRYEDSNGKPTMKEVTKWEVSLPSFWVYEDPDGNPNWKLNIRDQMRKAILNHLSDTWFSHDLHDQEFMVKVPLEEIEKPAKIMPFPF